MHDATPLVDLYLHIRVIIGMVLGLAVARLLNGVATFVQHPGRDRLWWPHLGWVAWMLLQVIGFWWWEFRLSGVQHWSFEAYVFVIAYAALLFFLCTLLFPSDLSDYGGYREYFMSRRGWFFGLLAAAFAMDIVDSWMKGAAHLAALGPEYWVRIGAGLILCLIAARAKSERLQGVLVVLALVGQAAFLATVYGTLL